MYYHRSTVSYITLVRRLLLEYNILSNNRSASIVVLLARACVKFMLLRKYVTVFVGWQSIISLVTSIYTIYIESSEKKAFNNSISVVAERERERSLSVVKCQL